MSDQPKPTQQSPTQQSPINAAHVNASPLNISDMILQNFFYSKIANMTEDIKITPANVLKIILLMIAPELRTIVQDVVKFIAATLSPVAFGRAVYALLRRFIDNALHALYPMPKKIDVIDKSPRTSITVALPSDAPARLIKAFADKSLIEDKSASFIKFVDEIIEVKVPKPGEKEITTKYSDVSICYEGVAITLAESLFVIERKTNNGITRIGGANTAAKLSDPVEVFHEKLRPIIIKGRDYIKEKLPTYSSLLYDKNSEIRYVKKILEKYPYFDSDMVILTVLSAACIWYKLLPGSLYMHGDASINTNDSVVHRLGTVSIDDLVNKSASGSEQQFINDTINRKNIMPGLSDTIAAAPKDISITFSSDQSKNDLAIAVDKLIDFIYKGADTEAQQSHYVHIKRTKTMNKVPNPEYALWEEKKSEALKIAKDKSAEELEWARTMPSKSIEVPETKSEIIVEKLDTVEKDLETLFLREKDKRHLMTALRIFTDGATKRRKFGYKNKCNIMLAGDPGTGKTTTIYAVATQMRRPLYYVDLRGIETNAELKSILDHINSQPARGIIVFEDIDGATNVVHRRFDKKHQQPPINHQPPMYRRSDMQPTIATMQDMNSALTLDFFLNTLQGMLTRDESMVIVTTNHLEKLDGAFMRDGRFDVLIELHLCDHHQLKSMFRAVLDIELADEHLRRLEEDKYTPGMVLALLERYSYEKQPVDVIIDELIERKKRFDELVNQKDDVDDFTS